MGVTSIDPRMLKQLLDLQIQRKLDIIPDGGSSPDSTGGMDLSFEDLLQTMLQSRQTASNKIIPASSLIARAKLSAAYVPHVAAASAGPSDYDTYIRDSSGRHGVDPSLVKAVIRAESSYNPNAVSPAGAKGLMQLMDQTGQGLGVSNPFDPKQNIEGGTKFLAGLLRKYAGNEKTALAAYNAGPGRIDSLGIRNDRDLEANYRLLPRETQNYITKVLGYKSTDQA